MERGAAPPDQDRTLVVLPRPGTSQDVSSLRESDRFSPLTQLIERIEALRFCEGQSTAKKASSARSSIVHLAHEPATCRSSSESAKVLRHYQNNQLRMLTHRWKMLGLQASVIGTKDDHTSAHLNQESKTDDCPLKITALQTSHSRVPRERQQENSNSSSSDVGIPEVKANNMDVPVSSNTAALEQSNSDNSDLSDQERGRAQVSKWSAPVQLYLRPEPYNNDLDSSYSSVTVDKQIYPQVLPAPLKDLDFTHGDPSTELSDSQQRLFSADPCLAPLVVRLLELEKLQAATVQKERAKRPTTARAQTKNSTRSRNCELPVSKSWSPEDAECNSVTCSFTKLGLCPNTSYCRCRRDACPLAKLRYRSRGMCLQQYQTLLKHPNSLPGKMSRPVAVVPAFSVSVKTSPKPKTPNRTRRLRTTKKGSSRPQRDHSITAKKTRAASIRKTEF